MEPVLYRAVELSDGDKKFAYTQRMIQMILDPNDGRSRHVRDLWVSEFSGTSEKFSVSDLEKIIAGLFRLQGFRYVKC